MLSICILQTQSPLKHLPDSITGHSDFRFWGGGKMLTPSCSWKRCCCYPVPKLGASCHCFTRWCVLVSPQARAQTGWGLVCPGHAHGLLCQGWIQSWKELIHSPKSMADFFWLCGYCSKTSKSRNSIFMETWEHLLASGVTLIWY